jgi:hypothetical protein
MFRPEGVYKIINATPEKNMKRIGRLVVFPFDIILGTRANILYIKKGNPKETAGKFLNTSAVQAIEESKVEGFNDGPRTFVMKTFNSVYTFKQDI